MKTKKQKTKNKIAVFLLSGILGLSLVPISIASAQTFSFWNDNERLLDLLLLGELFGDDGILGDGQTDTRNTDEDRLSLGEFLVLNKLFNGGWFDDDIIPDGNVATVPAPLSSVEVLSAVRAEGVLGRTQLTVRLRGELPDGCVQLKGISYVRYNTGNRTVFADLLATRMTDALCIQVVMPYDQTFTVTPQNLPPGTYTININGKTDNFSL